MHGSPLRVHRSFAAQIQVNVPTLGPDATARQLTNAHRLRADALDLVKREALRAARRELHAQAVTAAGNAARESVRRAFERARTPAPRRSSSSRMTPPWPPHSPRKGQPSQPDTEESTLRPRGLPRSRCAAGRFGAFSEDYFVDAGLGAVPVDSGVFLQGTPEVVSSAWRER